MVWNIVFYIVFMSGYLTWLIVVFMKVGAFKYLEAKKLRIIRLIFLLTIPAMIIYTIDFIQDLLG
jgi:hypothetical protein